MQAGGRTGEGLGQAARAASAPASFAALVDGSVHAAGAAAAIIGGIYLAAWWSGLAARWAAAGVITMKTNMALSLVVAGAALALLKPGRIAPPGRYAATAAGLAVLLIGALTLGEHLSGRDLGIDQLLAVEPPGAAATASPNRIGLPGSTSLALLGAGLVATAWKRRFAPYLGLTTCFIVLVPAIGFLYGIGPFYDARATGIAWPTVVALLSLGLGLTLANRDEGPLAVLWRDDPGGVLLRRSLVPAVLVPMVLGYVTVQGEKYGLYGVTTGIGLFALSLVLFLSVLQWRSAEELSASAARRRQATAQAEEAHGRLAAIVENTDDAIISKDRLGTILTWNAAAERLLGYAAEEVVGRPVDVIIPPERRQEENEILSRVNAGERISHFETQRLTKQGVAIDVSITVSPVRDRDGRIVGASKILRDVTEERRAREALREASRLKDDFLSMASHELRTPLTTLRLHAETLGRSLRKLQVADERVERKLSSMDSQFDRMEALVRSLLDVSRITAGRLVLERSEFDLAELTREVVERFEAQAETAGTELRLRAREVVGSWDRVRLDQVLTNLVSNAIKFGNGQPVDLEVDERDAAAVLVIRDQGIGIVPESQERIFEQFERAANTKAASGLGLGLWIARRMVEAHGGDITVASAPGAGAEFTVTLPRSAP